MVDFMFWMFVVIYLGLNAVIGIGASLGWIWEYFWVEQNFFGKICATVFYIPAYVLALLKYAVVFIFYWVFSILMCIFQILADDIMFKLYKKIKKFDLQGLTNTPTYVIIYM